MRFFDVLQLMLTIFFAIAAGYYANRKGFMGGQTDEKVSSILMNITVPCMTRGAVLAGDTLPELGEILSVLKVAAVFYGLQAIFALVLPRFLGGSSGEKGVWRYALLFSNAVFIGYPVAVGLFGPEALFFAVILALPSGVMAYTLGPLLLVGVKRFDWKKMFSPCVIASVLSLIFALTRVRLPAIVGESLSFVGDITVPLSLLLVGSKLAGLPARRIFGTPRLWGLSLARLVVLPAALWLILRSGGTNSMVMGIAVIQIAMPVAVNGTMLCIEHGGDIESMAQATFLSTLLSIVTIPLVAAVLL